MLCDQRRPGTGCSPKMSWGFAFALADLFVIPPRRSHLLAAGYRWCSFATNFARDTNSPLFAEADCGPRLQQPRNGKPSTAPRSSKPACTQRERRRHGGGERTGARVCALRCNRGFAGKPRGASSGARTVLKPSCLLSWVVEDGPTLQRAARRVCRAHEAPPQVHARGVGQRRQWQVMVHPAWLPAVGSLHNMCAALIRLLRTDTCSRLRLRVDAHTGVGAPPHIAQQHSVLRACAVTRRLARLGVPLRRIVACAWVRTFCLSGSRALAKALSFRLSLSLFLSLCLSLSPSLPLLLSLSFSCG